MDDLIRRADVYKLFDDHGMARLHVSDIDTIPSAEAQPLVKCPYCDMESNDFMPLNQTQEYSGIEIAINKQGLLRVRYYDLNGDTFETQDIVEVKYCPRCGKEFIK